MSLYIITDIDSIFSKQITAFDAILESKAKYCLELKDKCEQLTGAEQNKALRQVSALENEIEVLYNLKKVIYETKYIFESDIREIEGQLHRTQKDFAFYYDLMLASFKDEKTILECYMLCTENVIALKDENKILKKQIESLKNLIPA